MATRAPLLRDAPAPAATQAFAGPTRLRVTDLAKAYRGRRVVENVSLELRRGEAVGLLGPNGAGKTTCFYIITGLVAADRGTIWLDDADVTALPMHRRARLGIGYLPQEASIFRGLTVEDNIRAVLEVTVRDRKQRAAGLEALIREFDLARVRRSPALALSGGERRRCEIARALAGDPAFILLDEPLAGIDPINVAEIRDLVGHLKDRGLGVLITDHNVRDTLGIIDRAYILHDGRVLREGSPAAVVADPLVRQVYLGERFSPLSQPMSFAPGLRLDLKQTQSLVLTPQLQQAIRLLQMSNVELASAIDREVAENPFLDRGDRPTPANGTAVPDAAPTGSTGPVRADGHDDGWWQPPAGRAADCSLRLKRNAAQAFDEPGTSFEARLTRPLTLRDHLLAQIGSQVRDATVRGIGRVLVDLLDDSGYLREPDALLAQRLRTSEDVVRAARKALQACDPIGIGARDLAECLALQLIERDRFDPAMRALVANLPLLAKADFGELMRRCGVDADDLQEMIAELKRLDPRPGHAFAGDEIASVVPDVFVIQGPDQSWRVELNAANLPRVLVDRDYHAELCAGPLDRAARDYLSERFQSATWLAKALDQRARTMLKVTRSIFGRQRAFLERGAQALRPLVLRDIAEATGLHESTVSRATAEKYVATPHGTFPLKFFFTAAIAATAAGGEAHSAEAIRQQIKRLIDREDRNDVLSDDQIVMELKQRGVAIARRTVAKYRESLGIASSVERRRMKALGR